MRYAPDGFLALDRRAWGGLFDALSGGPQEPKPFAMHGDAAVVDVRGPLLKAADWCWDGYDAIRDRARAAFASNAKSVVLRIDSPGGDVAGCFELARELRALAASTGKRLTSYVDGMAASAAYALATAGAEIVVPETGIVGSIGVFQALYEQTAADAAMGVRFVFVASGERKLDGNPHTPITDSAVANLTGQVAQLADLFFALVAEHRGLDLGAIAKFEGATVIGARAVAARLADRVGTFADVVAGSSGAASTSEAAMSGWDDEKKALRAKLAAAAEGDDDEAKKAKKMLAALDDAEKEPDGDEEAKKAKKAEDEKKDAEAKAKAAEEEQKKDEEAKALASNAKALALKVQELEAANAKREADEAAAKIASARAALFAKRPDFSEAVKKTLASVPLAELEDAVKNWPRANASAGAAASAMTPDVSNGEPRKGAYEPKLTAQEQAVIAKLDAKREQPKAAVQRGNVLEMPMYTREQALARVAELEKLEKEMA